MLTMCSADGNYHDLFPNTLDINLTFALEVKYNHVKEYGKTHTEKLVGKNFK